jgi:hypothetical protein
VKDQSPTGQVCPRYIHHQAHTLSTGDIEQHTNPDAVRGQVSEIAPRPTPNVEHSHPHEATSPGAQTTWHVLALGAEIKALP